MSTLSFYIKGFDMSMFQQFVIFMSFLAFLGCSKNDTEEKSKADYKANFPVSHVYSLVNPYAVVANNPRLIIDLPTSAGQYQKMFDIEVSEEFKLLERVDGEQYLEVSLGRLPARQKYTFKFSYNLAQNPKSALSSVEPYQAIFSELIGQINLPENREITLKEAKKLVLESWVVLSETLSIELEEDPSNIKLIQNIVAADLLLSQKGVGEILVGFNCEQGSKCIVGEQIVWLEYLEKEVRHSEVLSGSVLSERRVAVKNLTQIDQVVEFLKNSTGVEGVGVLVSVK